MVCLQPSRIMRVSIFILSLEAWQCWTFVFTEEKCSFYCSEICLRWFKESLNFEILKEGRILVRQVESTDVKYIKELKNVV